MFLLKRDISFTFILYEQFSFVFEPLYNTAFIFPLTALRYNIVIIFYAQFKLFLFSLYYYK